MDDLTSARCRVCGDLFAYRKVTRPRSFCSDRCKRAFRAAAARSSYYATRSPDKVCKHCGKWFTVTSGGYWRTCSPECALELQRIRYRRKSYARRTHITGSYSMAEVAARAAGRCHICHQKVDLTLSGRDPYGPTVDHLIPLSEGGADELTNVALAHRQCNVRRGVRGEVQLVLI